MYGYEVILPKRLAKDIDLVLVCYAVIKSKSEAKEVLGLLKDKHPLGSLCHLKRIRSKKTEDGNDLQVIVSRTEKETYLEDVFRDDSDLVKYLTDFDTTYVAASQPFTRKQFTQASKYWPTSFHEDKKIKYLTSNHLFTKEEKVKHDAYMSMVDETMENGKPGTIIVDPKFDKIICLAHDCTLLQGDPLLHSVMVAIDMVAFNQGGGALMNLKYMFHDDKYLMLVEDFKEGAVLDEELNEPGYLCTGYDVYTTMEPCIMCSMALLHSRVQRVFYKHKNRSNGGLGTKYEIHCETGLNHHFDVFQMKLENT